MELGPISNRDLYGNELGRIADKMNLVHGVRAGWDDKQKYRDWLIEMVTKGHLSDEEYEARMEWVETVKTERELKVALTDLPSMPLTERPAPKQKKGTGSAYFVKHSPYYSAFIAGFEWVIFIVGLVTGAPFTIAIGGICGVIWTLITIKRYNDEKDKA